jgi:hypothetical protein
MLAALKDQELMPEGKNLRVERSSGAESLPKRREQRENDREHVVCNVSGCSSKFNWLNQNGVFDRDRAARLRRQLPEAANSSPVSGSSALEDKPRPKLELTRGVDVVRDQPKWETLLYRTDHAGHAWVSPLRKVGHVVAGEIEA